MAHSGPSSQPRRGWMSFFGKALREEKKLIPQPGATMMPGFSAILQRGLACDLDQGKTKDILLWACWEPIIYILIHLMGKNPRPHLLISELMCFQSHGCKE